MTPDVAVPDGVTLAWQVRDLASGRILSSREPDTVLPVASTGKLLLLLAVAARLDDGRLHGATLLERRSEDAVGDSGLWQHLRVDALPVEDLAVLVGSVSDNLATNVLLRHLGLDAVDDVRAPLGLADLVLHDRVRDVRTPADPPVLATGSAAALCRLMTALGQGTAVSPAVSARVLRWLGTGADLSMVALPLGLDPLAHVDADRGVTVAAKTGTDDGVRADVGVLTGPRAAVAYAAIGTWSPSGPDRRDDVLAALRDIGSALRRQVGAG